MPTPRWWSDPERRCVENSSMKRRQHSLIGSRHHFGNYVSVRQAGSGRVGWNGSIGMLLVLKLDLVDEVHFDLKWCLRWPVCVA